MTFTESHKKQIYNNEKAIIKLGDKLKSNFQLMSQKMDNHIKESIKENLEAKEHREEDRKWKEDFLEKLDNRYVQKKEFERIRVKTEENVNFKNKMIGGMMLVSALGVVNLALMLTQ